MSRAVELFPIRRPTRQAAQARLAEHDAATPEFRAQAEAIARRYLRKRRGSGWLARLLRLAN